MKRIIVPAAIVGGIGGACAAYVTYNWLSYGRRRVRRTGRVDACLLDHFMPEFEVVERHAIRVAAPATRTFRLACETDLMKSAVIRAVFKARQVIVRSDAEPLKSPVPLVETMRSIGWGTLAESPDCEVVMGAATQPWEKDVVFEAVKPGRFREFRQPGYVKIAWTIRVREIGANESLLATETRAIATDAAARRKFRWYWSFFSPGIILIRRMLLRQLRTEIKALRG